MAAAENWRIMSVSTAAGATLFTRIGVSASSLPRDFVRAITPALAEDGRRDGETLLARHGR
jgi:hypothetical protein